MTTVHQQLPQTESQQLPQAEPEQLSQIEPQQRKHRDPLAAFSSMVLARSDTLMYMIVGACFFLGAMFALCYGFWDFSNTILNIPHLVAISQHTVNPTTASAVVANAIIKLISDLLLVLIIMEVLSTVIHYLKSHATSLRPFLFIGIISATRGILSISARLAIETVTGNDFSQAMIELGVNAAVILALGMTLKMLGDLVDEHEVE
jgi:uncharacterized membrane protein (DUF373 family)